LTPSITPTRTVTPTNTVTPTRSLTPTPTVTPTLPALLLSVSASSAQSCYNISDASFTLSASGGNGAPYEYSRDNTNWQASATFSSLAGGSYTGYVRNNNRTGTVASVSVGNLSRTAPNATFTLSNYNGFNLSCNGGADGTIAVTNGTGGTGTGYSASTDNATYFLLPKTFTNQTQGNKTIYIKDSNGCVQSYDQTITQPTSQTATISIFTYDTGSCDGEVQLESTGGTWPKTYRLYRDTSTPYSNYSKDTLVSTISGVTSGASVQYVNGLCDSGRYWLEVTDANGCIVNSSTSVQLGGYFSTKNITFGAGITCGGGTATAVFLGLSDYQNYTASGNIYLAGMTLYSNSNGGTWSSGAGRVRDEDTGTVFDITNQGYLTFYFNC